MDKEREAFEDWIKNEDPFVGNDDNQDCIWAKKYMWQAWQAKAQAVPEGFVVVPKEPTEAMVEAGKDSSECGGWPDEIYKAMIEAQEPAND